MLGFLLLSVPWFRSLGNSALAATFSLSNFYFWSRADYFDSLAVTKPLLHTWSLAVEEQFYLLWPAIAVVIFTRVGRKYLPLFLLLTSIASIAIAEYLLGTDRAAAFYLLPPRAAELGIGGLMVWTERHPLVRQALATLIAASGIGLILIAIFFYTDHTRFPGVAALVPCLGTAMFIYAARQGPVAGIFRTAPAVWIGRISYSLYLVHWPLIVFYRAWTFANPTPAAQIALAALSILLAWAQFRFIEERYRYVRSTSWRPLAFAGGLAACAAVVAGAGSAVALQKGMGWRIPPDRAQHSVTEWRRIEREAYCAKDHPGLDKTLFTCQFDRGKDKDLFLWGDSHARHLVAGVSEAFPDYNIYTLYLSGCVPQLGFGGYDERENYELLDQCIARNRRALDYFVTHPGSNIILSNAKRATPEVMAQATRALLESLRAAQSRVAVLGDFIRPGIPLADCIGVPAYVLSDARIADRCHGNKADAERELAYNTELAKRLPELINPNDVQCPGGVCQFFQDGVLLYMDEHHLNRPGSIYFVDRMRDRLPF